MWLRSKLLPFVGKTVFFFIIVCAVWYFVAPAYNRLLAATASQVAPPQTIISSEQNVIHIFAELTTRLIGGYEIYGLDLQYGLLVVVALIAATPGLRLIQRLKSIVIAAIAMFVIHIVSILVFAHAVRSSTTGSVSNDPFVILFCIVGCDLFPVLVWGLLSYRYFSSRSDAAPIAAGVQFTPGGKKQKA